MLSLRPIRLLLLLLLSLLASSSLFAQQERILSFHSDISVEDDTSLLVTETISVHVANIKINHGIFRDFPTSYKDRLGNSYNVSFHVLSVTLDSRPEPFTLERQFNGVRVRIGDPKYFVQAGDHTYTISYTTNRQLGFFADHDELFWNVTGLGWDFPIDKASASVHLPSRIPPADVKLSGYTGPAGSFAHDLTTSSDGSSYSFSTLEPLPPHQGLTILLSWPKDYIAPPTFAQSAEFFFRDNAALWPLVIGSLVLLLYYLVAWSAVGRDPSPGVIMPLYSPPSDLSPAAMRYLVRMGYDNKTLTAAVVSMAARGFLRIAESPDGVYSLNLTGKEMRILSPDEQALASVLFSGRTSLALLQDNHKLIGDGIKALKKWLATAENKVYFVTNSRYLILPILLSVLVAGTYLYVLGPASIFAGGFLFVWLSLWTLGVFGLVSTAYSAWRAVFGRKPVPRSLTRYSSVGGATFITIFAVPFIFFEIMALGFLWKLTSISFIVFLIFCAVLHALFLRLLKAPTLQGRRLLDQVDGFKLFLGAVDADRLNTVMPPEHTPATFEKFLPYALALDLENQWSEKFGGVLATAGAAPSSSGSSSFAYSPSFYSGSGFSSFSANSFASGFSSSLTSAISSSSTAPGSSSGGGGGGGSGGGGGGGGGGGW